MEKAVFLDKDGTLIKDVPYNVDPARVKFYPDVFAALRLLQKRGYKLIIVSNQSGIAKRYFTVDDLEIALSELRDQLKSEHIFIDEIYYCPHGDITDEPLCNCRKPLPGMLLRAAEEHHIDLSQSWMIGDILNDVAAGRAAGCKTILVDRTGEERILHRIADPKFTPDFIVDDFHEINQIIALKKRHYEGFIIK